MRITQLLRVCNTTNSNIQRNIFLLFIEDKPAAVRSSGERLIKIKKPTIDAMKNMLGKILVILLICKKTLKTERENNTTMKTI